jgi:hypothetical protein
MCQGGGVEPPPGEASMGQASTIGLDIAKMVCSQTTNSA